MSRHKRRHIADNDESRRAIREELGRLEADLGLASQILQMTRNEVEVRTKRVAILRCALQELEQLR